MSDRAYIKLREHLDRFPLGFPPTASGVEIRILKRLFSEEEAEIAVLLTPFPETPDQIANRAGIHDEALPEKLAAMSRKGLIFRTHRVGSTLYNSAPFMIGLYEYSVKKIDHELAALFKEYYDKAYMAEMGASNIPGFKVLPIAENIRSEVTLFPYLKLKDEIRSAKKISVAECICRKESRLTGKGCDHPAETCLSFGVAAEYYIENGIGREVSPEEAISIIEEADRAGLVHAGANTRHLSNICNCCPCCCASMKGITTHGLAKKKFMNALFEATLSDENCNGCGECLERCPVGAISVDETAKVNRELCLGCGLCSTGCPSEAIAMRLRMDREDPFDRMIDLGIAILKAKKAE